MKPMRILVASVRSCRYLRCAAWPVAARFTELTRGRPSRRFSKGMNWHLGVLEEFSGAQFSHFKAVLTDLAVATLGPMGHEMKRLTADPASVDAVLRDGAARARAIAEPILSEVYDTVGFLPVAR